MEPVINNKPLAEWLETCPVLADIVATKPAFWLNQNLKTIQRAQSLLELDHSDVQEAADRLERFRPYIAQVFPETEIARGLIESPLANIPAMHKRMENYYGISIPGRLLVKLDSHLPISGSIKARGGIYEVLKFAETTAMKDGLLKTTDNYVEMDSDRFRNLFSSYSVVVGSTGNLGLSIGIISAKLGFQATVHMSVDAMDWKKEMLRARGVTVVEHEADYSLAVAEGREQAKTSSHCHFVDDESSEDLFLGYAVAAERLKKQLIKHSIRVDGDHPLCVYLPCGVGGGPGGITFGLKLAFGDHVHCFFAEPTQSPAMITGLATGLYDTVSTQELGIKNITVADGLAVSRPSGLVCRFMQHLLSGAFTVPDEEMVRLLVLLASCENIRLEPSALAGFAGIPKVVSAFETLGMSARSEQVTHLVWATGGSMVPADVWKKYHDEGTFWMKRNRHPSSYKGSSYS